MAARNGGVVQALSPKNNPAGKNTFYIKLLTESFETSYSLCSPQKKQILPTDFKYMTECSRNLRWMSKTCVPM